MNLELKYVTDAQGVRHLTIPDERRAAVVAFVREHAQQTPREIEARVQEGHDLLFAALDGVSEAQASYEPSADDWSILRLMAHVVSTKRVVGILAASLGRGERPPGFGPQFEEERAQDGVTIATFGMLAEALAAAVEAHAALIEFIRGIDHATNIELRFRHFVFGALNSREWAVFQRIHDGDHTPQFERIKASPGYPRE